MLEASLFGLACAFLWGMSDYFLSKGSKKLNLYVSNVFLKVPGLVLLVPFVLYRGFDVAVDKHFLILALAGLINMLAYFFHTKALSLGKAGVVVSIGSIYPIFTLIFSVVAVGLNLSWTNAALFILITVGVFFISSSDKVFNLKQFRAKPILYALLSAVALGVNFGLLGFIKGVYEWQELLLVIGSFMFIFSLLMYRFQPRIKRVNFSKQLKHAKFTIIAGTLLTLGSFFYYIGFEKTGAVTVLTIFSSTSPLFVIALGRYFNKETLHSYQYFGVVLVLGGVILLNTL